jgi:hypothetical protein
MKKIFLVLILLNVSICLIAEDGISYSYPKPANITETIQILRSDVLLRGGIFNGNEQEGEYNINGIHCSYRVDEDSVNINVFYDVDLLSATRASSFTFEFDKPSNITQSIQSVKDGIEKKGGYFSGNELNGNFRASGIAGQYNITERVSVSIIEKPFVFTNTFIEREIKNYFIGK